MTPDDHATHGGRQPQPQTPAESLPTLHPNATATIYYDGLIYSAFNETRRLAQAAIHTQAERHHLVIEVRLRGDDTLLFPTAELPWNSDHEAIKRGAPFWLYVDSGKGLNVDEKVFTASLHLSVADDPQSYNRILNFERLYHRPLPLKRDTFAEFNFPHGVSYSASHDDADLKTLRKGEHSSAAVFQRRIDVSTRGATDIDAVSDRNGKKEIVLANDRGRHEFFRFPLEAGRHYDINIFNQPIRGHVSHSPEDHFLQFYELFDLLDGEKRFLIEPAASPKHSFPDSPPCIGGSGSTLTGLSG